MKVSGCRYGQCGVWVNIGVCVSRCVYVYRFLCMCMCGGGGGYACMSRGV